jgi:uncharacterized membrane protein YgcG
VRRLLAVLALGLLAVLGAPLAAFADVPSHALAGFAAADDDYAKEFHVDYVLAADGSVEVTENITWQFPPGQERHGIFRNIKVRAGYQDRQDEYRYYELSQVSVSSPTGAPTDISISDNGAFKQIRVGSPSETVSGVQKYVVRYTLAHYVNDIGDGTAEFYFNTIDSSNYDRYDNVSASLQAPAAATKVACYYGPRGSTDTCDATAGGVSQFEAPDAQPGVGVSVIASYPRDAFGKLTVDLRKGSAGSQSESSLSPAAQDLVRKIGIAVGAFLPLAALAGMGALVWQRGRDETYAGLTPGLSPGLGQGAETVPTTRTPMAAVQFTPPEGVQPGMVGTVIDETANVVDVTATLIDLAVRGHLTIAKVEKDGFFGKDDWELTRTTPRVERQPLADYEQLLLSKVFATDNVIRLSSLRNTFASTLKSVQDHMYAEVVRRGWFARSPQSQRSGWVGLGTVLMVLGPVLFFFGGGVTGILGTGVGGATSALAIGLFLSGLIVRVLGKRMAARTAEGTAVLVQSRGFEEYLRTAEADQIKWEEAEQIFSRFLPYAIVFGLADRWAKVFAEVAAAAAAAGHAMAQPVWYIGPWDPAFGYGGLAHSMDDFSTTAAGTFVSTPGSSGGSGFSAGGGFSGGGGGGSSGGSW